jgi:small subunit ribosomal protein S8
VIYMKNTFSNYSVGDFLVRVKNAAMAGNKTVSYKAQKQIVAVAAALKKSGFLDEVKNEKGILRVSLTFKNKKAVMTDLKLVTKPGLRVYMGVAEIEKRRGPRIYIITTPKGIISSREAIKIRTGGEVIAEIW